MAASAAKQALCVSIHDVAPQTWAQCEQWLSAIHAVAEIPVTLLVAPHYHRHRARDPAAYDSLLENRLARGDELALHGFTHLDEGPPATGYWNKFMRHVYTRDEGEFYAIDADEARKRIELGLEWFNRRHWPVTGFVAPAWLLGPGAWEALRDFPFSYTTTLRRFYVLPERRVIRSASMVYSVGSGWRRYFSYTRNAMLQNIGQEGPLLRLSLHPNDITYPDVVRHSQVIIEKLLASRQAMTKGDFAELAARRARAGG